MEDGDESVKLPQRPKLGPRPIPEEAPREESYGRSYYDANTSMREAAPPPVRPASKTSGGWMFLLILGGAAAYFYFYPGTVRSAISAFERWVVSLRGTMYEGGRGYGDIPEAERFETKR